MIPVLVKTELRKASENELKLNKKDPQGSKCPFPEDTNFCFGSNKSPRCFPL